MSVTVAKANGVTVLTLTADPESSCPPLCQILKGLCYNPLCFSKSQRLRRYQKTSQSTLGALHIMVGLLNIGLGLILSTSRFGSSYQMDSLGYPYWMGGLFVFFGAVGILSEKIPAPCLVILNVTVNLVGVALSIAAIVLYSINIGSLDAWWLCNRDYDDYNYYHERYGRTTPAPSSYEIFLKERCLEGKNIILMLLGGINVVLIILSVLEVCVTLSSAILAIKALASRDNKNNKSSDEPEKYTPLLDEVTNHPTV